MSDEKSVLNIFCVLSSGLKIIDSIIGYHNIPNRVSNKSDYGFSMLILICFQKIADLAKQCSCKFTLYG